MRKWSWLEEHHREWQDHREILQIVEDSRSQQMLKSERKDKFFLHVITHFLYKVYLMDLKSMVSSLEKLYYGLDLDDATMCKYLVGVWEDLLYSMLSTKNMFVYLLR